MGRIGSIGCAHFVKRLKRVEIQDVPSKMVDAFCDIARLAIPKSLRKFIDKIL